MKNILKFGLVGIAAFAFSSSLTTSTAQSRLMFDGEYRVTGLNPDGSDYGGAMTIARYGDGYRITQAFGSDTYLGIGNDMGDYLAGAFIYNGKPVVSLYRVIDANTLSGFWQEFDSTKEGQEKAVLNNATFSLIPAAPVATTWNYSGTYGIKGTAPSGAAYTGTMALTNYGDGYRASYVSGTTTWRGIASYIGKYLAISWQAGNNVQVSIFEGNPRTGDLKGYWQDYNSLKEGAETATLK